MTSRKNKQEQELDIREIVENFEDNIESLKKQYPEKEKRFDAIIKILETPLNSGIEFEEKKDEMKAVEQYFLCLGLLKKVLDSDLFKFNKDRQLLQALLIRFDLPCSLRMCRIMFEGGNYDEVYNIAERVLAVDPDNQEAKDYINYIKRAEKDKDWRRLKDAKDVQSYISEYYKIQQEREQRENQKVENKKVRHLHHERDSDPAKYILHSLETIIKFVLMIPFMLYSKIGEPLLHMFYEIYLFPLYEKILHTVPFSAPVLKVVLYSGSKFIGFFTSIVEYFSGKAPEEPKQSPKREQDEAFREKKVSKEGQHDVQFGSVS